MESVKLLGYAGLELIANELLPLNYLKRTGGTLSGNLNISNKSPVLTVQNINGTDSSLVLDRSGNANWRFLSSVGDLYFQCDFTDKKGDYYNVLKFNYNSGNATFKGTVTAPTFAGNLSGTASVATKLGSSTVGSSLKPFYLNAGTPTAFSSTVGSASIPVYLNAGTIIPCTSLSLNTTGSAARWTTARTLSLTGSVTGSASFDGSGNITLSTSTNHTHSYLPLSGGRLTGDVIFTGDNILSWSRNTDCFKIGFKNDSDSDVDSYGYIRTGDNGNEYFRIERTSGTIVTTIASFRAEGLRLGEGNFIGDLIGNATSAPLLKNLYPSRPTSADIVPTGSGGVITFKATSTMVTNKPGLDGHILHFFWDNTGGYDSQLVLHTQTGHMQARSMMAGTWGNWLTFLDSSNYTSYTVTKTGSGASGTWGIGISGNAATATKATQDGYGNVIAIKYVSVDTTQTITGSKTFSGLTSVTNTTASTSKSTGALKVSGGVGVSGQISADKMMVGDKVTLQYNVANECIDFIFA